MLIDELMRIMSELESGAEPDDPYSGRNSDDVIVESKNYYIYNRRITMQGRTVIAAVAEKL